MMPDINNRYEVNILRLETTVSKLILQEFINSLMKIKASLYWRYKDDIVYLIIDKNESIIELPFNKTGSSLEIKLKNHHIQDEDIIEELEKMVIKSNGMAKIKKLKNGQIEFVSYENGKIKHQLEEDEEGIANKFRFENVETIEYIIKGEIDYYLMELCDYIKSNNLEKIEKTKEILLKLNNEKKKIEILKE